MEEEFKNKEWVEIFYTLISMVGLLELLFRIIPFHPPLVFFFMAIMFWIMALRDSIYLNKRKK